MKNKSGPSFDDFQKGSTPTTNITIKKNTFNSKNQKGEPKQKSIDLSSEEKEMDERMQDQDVPENYEPLKNQATKTKKKTGDAKSKTMKATKGGAQKMISMKEIDNKGKNGEQNISTTKTEIQELREMQISIQKQLQEMQSTFLDKFSQLKVRENSRENDKQTNEGQPKATDAAFPPSIDTNVQLFGQGFSDQQQNIPPPANPPSLGGVNIDVNNAAHLNQNNNSQLIVNLYQCIQGLQAQVAQLQSQVHLQNQSQLLNQQIKDQPKSLYGAKGFRNNSRTNVNSYSGLPQTVKPYGRKTFDLPELKGPKRGNSRNQLFPSQGGSLTPMASMPNLPPFNNNIAFGRNALNTPQQQYQTPKQKMKKKKNNNMVGPTIMGSHSYHNRKPESNGGIYQNSDGFINVPNTSQNISGRNNQQNMVNIQSSNWPLNNVMEMPMDGNQVTPVYNAKKRNMYSGGRVKNNYSEIGLSSLTPAPEEFRVQGGRMMQPPKRNIMSTYTSKTNNSQILQKANDFPAVQEKMETSSQRLGGRNSGTEHPNSMDKLMAPQDNRSMNQSTRFQKQQTVTRFIERQQTKIQEKQQQTKLRETIEGKAELFAEKFSKFKVRDYSNNTRMNIKNQDYANMRQKRDRAINYWQNQVIQNYLPPIDQRKKQEMNELKKLSTSVSQNAFKKSYKSPQVHGDESKRFPQRKNSTLTRHMNNKSEDQNLIGLEQMANNPIFEPAQEINDRNYNTNDIYDDAVNMHLNVGAQSNNEMAGQDNTQNFVNWNDIDRVPSSQNEVTQDKQMGLGDSATQPESNHRNNIPSKGQDNDGTLNDRTNNYKSPILPLQSEDLSEQILNDELP